MSLLTRMKFMTRAASRWAAGLVGGSATGSAGRAARRGVGLGLPAILSLAIAGGGLCGSVVCAEDLQAEKIHAWEFQRSEDRNVDQWPDGWRRRTGRNFPGYVPIRIAPRDPDSAQAARAAEPVLSRMWLAYRSGKFFKRFIPESTPEPIAEFLDRFLINNCLTIEMDGGAAEVQSPAFRLDPRFTYTLDASLACEELEGHRAWVEILMLDAAGEVVASAKTPEVTGTSNWRVLTTRSLSSEGLQNGQVIIHVEPLKSSKLNGKVRVDEIRLYRMPKLELALDVPHHVAAPDQPVEVTCAVLGVQNARSMVNFRLIDHFGQTVQRATAPLTPVAPSESSTAETAASDEAATMKAAAANEPRRQPALGQTPVTKDSPDRNGGSRQSVVLTTAGARPSALRGGTAASKEIAGAVATKKTKSVIDGADGVAHWQVRVAEPGYYRVVVDLGRTAHSSNSRQISREASLAIVEDARVGVSGPFGWSLPEFNANFTPEVVPELVKLGGVGWLKIPVWFDPRDVDRAERLSLLLERLDLRKVSCVGLLDQPSDPDGGTRPPVPAAVVFSSPESWEAQLEPALTRMSMKLNWFQLGRDHDRSFIGNPTLIPLLADIRNRMQSYCQELQLALSWDYQDPIPGDKNLPWRASQMSAEPQLTARELESELTDPNRPRHTRWVTLDPIPASRYRTLDRVRDLTERMLAVKRYQVEAAFITNPLSRETGIFNPDGSVGELFLPWRLLNRNMATATYLGSFTMPGGSTNHVFSEGQRGFMLVWNDRTAVEQLYLGEDVHASDLWGKSVAVEQVRSDRNTPEQKLTVTPWPMLLHGLSVPVANWRMRFELEKRNLPSTLAQRAELPITVENTLSQSGFGSLGLTSPTLLQPGMAPMPLQLNAGERRSTSLPVPLRNDASAGKHMLRFDFQINSDREYDFSVYDSLTLGIGDVELQWEAIEVSKEQATLRVELANKANRPVSFDCKLFPPQQPYRRFQISDAPPGHTVRDIVLPLTGAEGGSVLWIRCEELGTGRVLNYRVPLALPKP